MPVIHVDSEAQWHQIKGGVKGASFGSAAAVIVDFSAEWCGPCKAISPIFEQLSGKPEFSSITFCKVDVDQLQDVASACGVRAMPTFQAYLGGEKVGELTGANPAQLEALIKDLAAKAGKSSAGTGQKLGGDAAAAPQGGADDMRARMAAAAEARLKAQGA